MADDIKKGFPIKSGGYFPRRYLIPRHRAQTLYSAPFKAKLASDIGLEKDSSTKISSPPLRLKIERVGNQHEADSYKPNTEVFVALATPESFTDES